MKTAAVKSRAALKKSAVISNSRRPKKSAVKSVRPTRRRKPLFGSGKGEIEILGDIINTSLLKW